MTTPSPLAVKAPDEHPVLAAARQLAPRLSPRSEEIETARRLGVEANTVML